MVFIKETCPGSTVPRHVFDEPVDITIVNGVMTAELIQGRAGVDKGKFIHPLIGPVARNGRFDVKTSWPPIFKFTYVGTVHDGGLSGIDTTILTNVQHLVQTLPAGGSCVDTWHLTVPPAGP